VHGHWKIVAKASLIAVAVAGSAACAIATAGICGVAIGEFAMLGAIGAAEGAGMYGLSGGKHTASGYGGAAFIGFAIGGPFSWVQGSSALAEPEGTHAAESTMSQWLRRWF